MIDCSTGTGKKENKIYLFFVLFNSKKWKQTTGEWVATETRRLVYKGPETSQVHV